MDKLTAARESVIKDLLRLEKELREDEDFESLLEEWTDEDFVAYLIENLGW